MTQASTLIDLAEKYMWAINKTDLDAAKELQLIGIKKYRRPTRQVEME